MVPALVPFCSELLLPLSNVSSAPRHCNLLRGLAGSWLAASSQAAEAAAGSQAASRQAASVAELMAGDASTTSSNRSS